MKNLISFLILWISCLEGIYAQNLAIQYNQESRKAFFKKTIEVQANISEEDIYQRAGQWLQKNASYLNYRKEEVNFSVINRNSEPPAKLVYVGKGASAKGVDTNTEQGTLTYDFRIEVRQGKCTILVQNLENQDAKMYKEIEWQAFKEDGSRKTAPARIKVVESVEKTISELINSLDRAINN